MEAGGPCTSPTAASAGGCAGAAGFVSAGTDWAAPFEDDTAVAFASESIANTPWLRQQPEQRRCALHLHAPGKKRCVLVHCRTTNCWPDRDISSQQQADSASHRHTATANISHQNLEVSLATTRFTSQRDWCEDLKSPPW
jgi:hypothetical protein